MELLDGEESFEELLKDYEQGGFELKRNDVVEGTIVQVNPDSVGCRWSVTNRKV